MNPQALIRCLLGSLLIGGLARSTTTPQPASDQDSATPSEAVVYPVIRSTFDLENEIDLGPRLDGPVQEIHRHAPPLPNGQPPDDAADGEPPGASFGGCSTPVQLGFNFGGIGYTNKNVPDPHLAVGPGFIVAVVNSSIVFFNKSTGSGVASFSLNNFFGIPFGQPDAFDPKCIYDQFAKRFIVVAVWKKDPPGSVATNVYLAASDDADPNGTWYAYATSGGGSGGFADYPGIGLDQQGLYVVTNQYSFCTPPCSPSYLSTVFRVFNKRELLAGAPLTSQTTFITGLFTMQPAHMFGFAAVPYFAGVRYSPSQNPPSEDEIVIYAITDPVSNPQPNTYFLTIGSFLFPQIDAPQLGSSAPLDVVGDRAMNACWRNHKLYLAHTVMLGGQFVQRNFARWLSIYTNGWPLSGGTPTLDQGGDINGGVGTHTFMPAVMVDKDDGLGIVLARSSSSEYAGIYLTGREPTDPIACTRPLVPLKVGTSAYTGGYSPPPNYAPARWGDYFGIALDPVDQTKFWAVGEYAVGTGTWATWIGSFTIP